MASASDSTVTSYDRVPYKSHPFRQSHPDRLAVIATLHGMSPVPIERARVLELGCASGGNLVPMADQFPDAMFLGLDMSRVAQLAIASCVRSIRNLRLTSNQSPASTSA